MSLTGPDLYRLAHLEAGIVANRMSLAAEGLGLAWRETPSRLNAPAERRAGHRLREDSFTYTAYRIHVPGYTVRGRWSVRHPGARSASGGAARLPHGE